jgi:N-methylhydantoinase A
VTAPSGALDDAALANIRTRFDAMHERLHGHQAPGESVEIVSYRLVAMARVPRIELRRDTSAGGDGRDARKGERLALFPDTPAPVPCPVFDRTRLQVGARVEGPAIVEQLDSTAVIYPHQVAVVDDHRNLVIRVGAD